MSRSTGPSFRSARWLPGRQLAFPTCSTPTVWSLGPKPSVPVVLSCCPLFPCGICVRDLYRRFATVRKRIGQITSMEFKATFVHHPSLLVHLLSTGRAQRYTQAVRGHAKGLSGHAKGPASEYESFDGPFQVTGRWLPDRRTSSVPPRPTIERRDGRTRRLEHLVCLPRIPLRACDGIFLAAHKPLVKPIRKESFRNKLST
jgi:hypothetical protein